MRGKGECGDFPGCSTRSRNSRLKSSHAEGNFDNVVIIDVDSENVIVVDVPESLRQKLGRSSVLREGGKFPFQGIVNIEDDDVDDDELDPLDNNAEGDRDLDNDGTGSDSNPASDHAERFGDGDDDCQVVNKKAHPFKLSKCKRTCAEKTTGRNHYGLNSECESDSSQSDSDCEVIDGSSGEFRRNWEKAFLKRKSAHKNRHRQEDQAVPCSSHETDTNAEAEKKTDKNTEPCTNFENSSYGVFTGTQDGAASGDSCNVGIESFFTTFNGKADGARFPRWCKPRTPRNMNSSGKADDGGETSGRDSDDTYDECQHMNDFGTKSAPKETSCARRFSREECDTHFHQTRSFSQNDEQTSSGETSEFETWGFQGECIFSFRPRQSAETHHFNRSKVFPGKKDKMSFASSSGPKIYSDGIEGEGSGVHDKNKEFHGQKFSFHGSNQSEETVIEIVGSSENKGKAVLEESFIHANEKPGHRDKDKIDVAGRSFYRTQFDETASRMEASIVSEQKDPFADPKSNLKLSDDRDLSSTTVNDLTTVVQENIINDREKLKETDEYRRAMEEEWAARQRQLKIQAEEAQRQRKRRKAESLRVIEMKKRQKQRLEEVRESQKKVEENLNMKERLRSEVRNEICRLEVMCNDMASLLRGLGIQVGGGSFPSSDEVHAAYKRALLKFHPDRASRTDIQKQVEAEEKFKLISRMKEKFLSTSC